MIIEDSKTDVFLIREAIDRSRVNADTNVLRDGHAATKYFQTLDSDEKVPCPDLILLDLNLPKMSGYEVLQHLRASQRCKHSKVIIVTSSDAPSDRATVEQLSATAYFKKPSVFADFMKLGPLIDELLAQDPGPGRAETRS